MSKTYEPCSWLYNFTTDPLIKDSDRKWELFSSYDCNLIETAYQEGRADCLLKYKRLRADFKTKTCEPIYWNGASSVIRRARWYTLSKDRKINPMPTHEQEIIESLYQSHQFNFQSNIDHERHVILHALPSNLPHPLNRLEGMYLHTQPIVGPPSFKRLERFPSLDLNSETSDPSRTEGPTAGVAPASYKLREPRHLVFVLHGIGHLDLILCYFSSLCFGVYVDLQLIYFLYTIFLCDFCNLYAYCVGESMWAQNPNWKWTQRVATMRSLCNQMGSEYFSEIKGRVEFLPISWHEVCMYYYYIYIYIHI